MRVRPSQAGLVQITDPVESLFVLRNPGVSPSKWNVSSRDKRLAAASSRFKDAPTVENYRALVSEMHAQMQGRGSGGSERWGHGFTQ